METFVEVKKNVDNANYLYQRQKMLQGLADATIDRPIIDLVNRLNRLPYCFTLQSCFGHFVYSGQDDPHNLEPLPVSGVTGTVEYRIAYLAICIENNPSGQSLLNTLNEVAAVDLETVQFGCADWFWKKQVNSYVLQVEPSRFKCLDTAMIGIKEALHLEKMRKVVFSQLYALLKRETEKIIG